MEKVFSRNLEYNSAPAGPCMAASHWDCGPLSRINVFRRPVPRSPLFLLAPCPHGFKPAKNAMLKRNYRKPPQLSAAKSPISPRLQSVLPSAESTSPVDQSMGLRENCLEAGHGCRGASVLKPLSRAPLLVNVPILVNMQPYRLTAS
jgi:hypothetical protein